MRFFHTFPFFALTLAGCGSNTTYVDFFATGSAETSTITAHGFNSVDYAVASGSGTLTRDTEQIDVLSLTGAISADLSSVAVSGGGTGTLTDLGFDHVAMFSVDPFSGPPLTGVTGVATNRRDLPSGTATYSGVSNVQIVDSVGVFDLSGDVAATADFRADRVTLVHDGLSGTMTTGASTSMAVTDVATITIDNAVINGAAFSGGTARVQSTVLAAFLSGLEEVSVSGGFYGPDADELGGVFVIDDTGNGVGRLLLFGSFAAD